MVRKPDGSIRVCIDFCAIIERTVKDLFHLPRIEDLIDKLREANCITHLDLESAYNQVKISHDGSTDITRLLQPHFKDSLLMVLLVY